jgi:hypothetical protein
VGVGRGRSGVYLQTTVLIQIGSQLGRHVFSRVGDWWVIGHTRLFHGSVLDWWRVVEAKVAVSGFSADGRRGMFAFTRHFLHSCLFTRSSMGVILYDAWEGDLTCYHAEALMAYWHLNGGIFKLAGACYSVCGTMRQGAGIVYVCCAYA